MSGLSRLGFDALQPTLREALRPTVERLGYLGEFFQYLGHAPEALEGFMKFSGSLKSTIPANLNEVIALAVCVTMDLPYERIQHERLSLTLGFTREWIAAAVSGHDVSVLSEAEARVRALTVLVVTGADEAARTQVDAVAQAEGQTLAAAVLFQITRFMSVCRMGRVLKVELPLPSIFED